MERETRKHVTNRLLQRCF